MPSESQSGPGRKRKLPVAAVVEEDQNSMDTDKFESHSFKNPNFVHSVKAGATSKRRVWKNLKQIIAAEKSLNWPADAVTYSNIEAPPSFYPAKKYSDISGLPAIYIDPHTKLRYSTTEEFAQIRTLPSDIIAGLLQLRKANKIV